MGRSRKNKNEIQRLARQVVGKGNFDSLCLRAAKILGKPWDGSKKSGYVLLKDLLCSRTGIDSILAVVNGTSPKPAIDPNGDDFLFSYEWRSLRMRVLKHFGARCQCCGATAKDGVMIHVDHIKPRRLFPDLALEETNLQVLCEACNHGKGNWDQTDWRPAVVIEAPADHKPVWRALIKTPE